jgi:uncharacterized protein (DUF1800 family)
MSGLPSLTTSYTFNLVNPIPVVTAASPTQLLTGGTQTVTLTGSGFVAGATVLFQGNSLATTYASYNKITVPGPVPANASGSLSLQVDNPTPGGGAGTTLTETVAGTSIALTATDGDGANTGTAELGVNVSMAAAVTGSDSTAVTWSLTGAGSISASGVYTAPATMPASSAVTITATLTSNTAITASYSLNLINPLPTIASSNSTGLPAGNTTAVTLTGTGFLPSTVFTATGGTVTTTYQSLTSVSLQVALSSSASGTFSIQAQNPSPGGGTGAAFQIPIWTIQITATDPDGTNTGTARLGVPVNLAATVSAGNNNWAGWALSGVGSIAIGGTDNTTVTYTPPTTMPSLATATITAHVSAVPSITQIYTINLINPVPTVTSATPTQLLAGGTQTVTLTGSGFVAGTTVSFNGSSLPITYKSSTSATVAVPVPATSNGSMTLQALNPAPGGGAGSSFVETIAGTGITLTATDQDGTNTGTAELGINVTMAATVSGSTSSAVTWSVIGAGSISSTGVYTAPAAMPAANAVTITATLTSNTAITATYKLNIVDPVPVITGASVASLPAGTATAVTITGTGFVPGTTFTAAGGTVTASYQSATSILAQVTLGAGASGNFSLQAQNAAPGGGTSAALQIPIWSIAVTAIDSDGTNTGTGRLGVPVRLSAATVAGGNQSVTWVLTGGGTLTPSTTAPYTTATYTPPQVMPAGGSVLITAYVTGAPTVTASYSLTLINPVPSVTAASPTQLLTGSTQTVTLTGSGFVAGTTVLFNGSSLPIAYSSYTKATVAVPVAANATGSLSFQVQNPTPGGGAGSTFTESLSGASIALTAVDQDGTNTGTAELGINVTMTAAVTGSSATAVTWSVTGGGTISATGVYTSPTAMPASTAVTITATLTSNTAITASYNLSLVSPAPAITSASVTNLPAGTTASVTLTGTGFIPSTTFTASGGTVTATYVSTTSVTAQVTVAAGATGNFTIEAQNPSPGGGTSAALTIPVWYIQATATDPDGTNTGTARLGVPVSITTTYFAGTNEWMAWTLTGPGSISKSGTYNQNVTYTPPTTMPSPSAVTLTATMSADSAVTTTYNLVLAYPVPVITSVNPTTVSPGSTTTISMDGTGFEAGMVVNFNGTPYTPSISSSKTCSIKVTVPGTATGSASLVPQNPTPGGGSGASFPIALNTPAIALTAKDGDGTNTGTAELGVNVTMSAAVTDTGAPAVTWSVTGGGSISASGVYTAPTAMPTSNAVTITATLTSNPTITASYQLNIINPIPVVKGFTVAGVPAGTATSFNITGSGFVPGTVFTSTGGTITTTYVSATAVTAQATLPSSASGIFSVQAQSPAPGGGTSSALSIPIYTVKIAAVDPDGTNTGTARLGVPVTMTATAVAGQPNEWISWTLTGPGTLNIGGSYNVNATYTPPTVMPAATTASITAVVGGLTSLTTTYTVSLVDPFPVVTSATPSQLLTGSTQAVALAGSGFVPGMVVVMNGSPLATTYTGPTAASVQVPVAANASGTLSLQAQNPAPGGGAGTAFTETIESDSISLTATDADGTNTGTAELGVNVTMTASVSGAAQPAVNWSLSGPGSISATGVYTAPAALPSGGNQATITATLVSNPAIAASYSLNVVYPVPVIVSANEYVVSNVQANYVTLNGTGFVPQTTLTATNATVAVTYQSPTSLLVELTVNPGTTGTVVLQAENPSPGGGASSPFNETIASTISATAAARLLDQTTFGPTAGLIQTVQNLGVNGWLAQQFNTPPSLLGALSAPYPAGCAEAIACAESEWWQAVITGQDQLRQRVAFALSQIFVISTDTVPGGSIPQFHNILSNDAFTNWYRIMQDVATSPGMGMYLNMLNSELPTTAQEISNENFARENMQLFNLGLYLLNQDGSLQTVNGNPVPTYNEAIVQSFARLFTGWTFANPDGTKPPWFIGVTNFTSPMVGIETSHDENPKTLLDDASPTDLVDGTVLPGGQTAEQDLAQGMLNVFNHPNVPPFVSRLLIQHLTTGNPSPAYVARVAAVFTNNGNNVRGDMTAVVTAILTDPEARAADTNPPAAGYGHLREPTLWMADVIRGLGIVNVDPNDNYVYLSYYTNSIGEQPYQASDVFNFFPPSYVIPSTVSPQGLVLNAPEFGIENSGSVMGRLAVADTLLLNYLTGFNVDFSASSPLGQIAATNPAAMVDQLGLIFMHAQMDPNVRTAIVNEISNLPNVQDQCAIAAYLVVTSNQYKIIQ